MLLLHGGTLPVIARPLRSMHTVDPAIANSHAADQLLRACQQAAIRINRRKQTDSAEQIAYLLSATASCPMPDKTTFWCSTGIPVAETSFCFTSAFEAASSMSIVTSDLLFGLLVRTCTCRTSDYVSCARGTPFLTAMRHLQQRTRSLTIALDV